MRVLNRPDWAGDFTLKRIRHTPEQIIRKLKTAEQLIAQGKTVADVCRVIEVTQPTYHRWSQQYGVMQAVEDLRARFQASGRFACRVVGQHRSTQRHDGKVVGIEEVKLRRRLREIAAEHIHWGRRMAYRMLRREGWAVNHKRVHPLWREEGLQRPTPRKQKRARPADGSVRRHQAEHPHQMWAMDFQFDATADGRRLKFLNVIDEHSRFCLTIRVGRRCKARDVVAVLEELTSLYPALAFVRSDNGPEFIAHALRCWCNSSGTATA